MILWPKNIYIYKYFFFLCNLITITFFIDYYLSNSLNKLYKLLHGENRRPACKQSCSFPLAVFGQLVESVAPAWLAPAQRQRVQPAHDRLIQPANLVTRRLIFRFTYVKQRKGSSVSLQMNSIGAVQLFFPFDCRLCQRSVSPTTGHHLIRLKGLERPSHNSYGRRNFRHRDMAQL